MINLFNNIAVSEKSLIYLVYLVTFPVVADVIHHFFKSLLGCKIKKEIYIYILFCVYYLANCILYIIPMNDYSKTLFNFLLILGVSFFYKKSFIWRISASLFLLAIIIMSEVIAMSGMMVFISGNKVIIIIIKLVFGKLVLMVIELIAVRLFTSFGKGNLTRGYWLSAMLCPTFSVVIICAISQVDELMQSEFMPVVFLPISVVLVFINFFIYIVCDNIMYKQYTDKQTLLLGKQVEYYVNQYQLAEQFQKETNKFRHDIKNILIGLKTQLESSKKSAGEDMIDTLIADFSSSKGFAHSGNIVIDSIINYKKQQGDLLAIAFYLELSVPDKIMIDTTSVSVILGNTLDNAMEACKLVEDQEKYIKIQINYENESLFIHIENPYTGIIRTDKSGRILSKKTDSKEHGIGIQSIRETVEKINGILDITYDHNIFMTEIVLFEIKNDI